MSIFGEISVIIAIAAVVSIIMRALRQPLIIGYIIAGLLVGPAAFGLVRSYEAIEALGEIGIAFLLFIVGLNLTPKILKEVGMVSLVTGLGQIIFTALIGFGLATTLGFSASASWYIAIALTFSSTIIILKLLSDKDDLDKLYAKISIGFLLFQDIVAMVLLIVISSLSQDAGGGALGAGVAVLKGIVLAALFFAISTRFIPRLHAFLARSQETLFVFSIGWGLGVAALFHWMGLSIEVGSLIAGVTLAASPYHHEMSARMRPLRDFFLVLFFVFLGSQMSLGDMSAFIVPALVLSLFVVIGNPLIVMTIMGASGYRKRTAFLSGLTVAQISEFSLIVVALGVKTGHVSGEILSLVTLVGIITIAASTYLILYAEKLYRHLEPLLWVFERKKLKEKKESRKNFEVVLFGSNRIGYEFIEMFRREKIKFLVVDHDPEAIVSLQHKKIPCRYGDAEDVEFIRELGVKKTKMAISTIPDVATNELIVRAILEENPGALVVLTAHNVEDAQLLYNKGASYVIMPHFLGGTYASELVGRHRFSEENFKRERAKHIAYLETKKKLGHQHPPAERFR